MSRSTPSELVLRIERAYSSPIDAETVLISLSGRWLGAGRPAAADELLVVEVNGRRSRFAARSRGGGGSAAVSGLRTWTASFELPVWAEPRAEGQAFLWVGNSVVEVPPVSREVQSAEAAEAVGTAETVEAVEAVGAVGALGAPAERPGSMPSSSSPAADQPRSAAPSQLLRKEVVSALRAELRERSTELAQVRGALTDAASRLHAGAAVQAQMQAAHAELRVELEQLTALVEQEGGRRAQLDQAREAERREAGRQREDLDRRIGELEQLVSDRGGELRRLMAELVKAHGELAAATASRDGALSEAAGLRRELDRLGGELAGAREQLGAGGSELGQARALLADARALSTRLRARSAQPEPPAAEPPS